MSAGYQAPGLLIQGQWRPGRHSMSMPIINPATAQTLDTLHLASRGDIEQALQAAQTGYEAWRCIPAHERCALLEKGVNRIRQTAGRGACRVRHGSRLDQMVRRRGPKDLRSNHSCQAG